MSAVSSPLPRARRAPRAAALCLGLAHLVGCARPADAKPPARSALDLATFQKQYDRPLHDGLRSLHVKLPVDVLGDNTDPSGMLWTKCTNLGLDILATLVAESRSLVTQNEARLHVARVLDVLEHLQTFSGIFPEHIVLNGGAAAEVRDGRVRYSSIDSGWVTAILGITEARYRSRDPALAARARKLVENADYGVFVRGDGLMGDGISTDQSGNRALEPTFAYDNKNSEARPIVLALIGLGRLPPSAWDNMHYGWTSQHGAWIGGSYHFNAFAELTGQLFFDEMKLAPGTLGKSHTNYVTVTSRIAEARGHTIWGYAPACHNISGYTEYGLDRTDVVAPYAAAQLATTRDPRALLNLQTVLAALPSDGKPLPDGLDPTTKAPYCHVSRSLDQALLFLAVNAPTVQSLTRAAPFYASAEKRLRQMDRDHRAPE